MEKVARKKARKGLKKRTVLILAVLAAAAAGAGVYFLRAPKVPVLPETEKAMMLLDRDTEEISALAVAPEQGIAYPLVRGEAGFYLPGKEGMALRARVIDDMLQSASSLRAEETVLDTAETAIDPAHFGLSPARVRVTVSYTDGSRAALLIGDAAPDDIPQRYCMRQGDSRLYTVLSADCEPFFHEVESLRDFAQPQLDPSLLDRIDVSGDYSLGMYYTPSGWMMDVPYGYPLSLSRMKALLDRIGEMGFDSCLGGPEEVALADYGLDHPALTVLLTQAPTVITGETASGEQVSVNVPRRQYRLLIGDETGQSGVYVLWEGMVYKASNFLLGIWKQMDLDALLLREPVNLLVNDLRAVTFSAGERQAAYEVRMVESITENNRIATDEYGNTLYDCAVRRAGEERDMDAEAFLAWYRALATLAPAGRLPAGYAPTEKCRGKIVLTNDAFTRQIEFYPYDGLHDALAVDGVFRFYTEKTWLDQLPPAP